MYRDLQPYICSFADCNSGIETFASRRQWAEHEFVEHREKNHGAPDWILQEECPFCLTCPASTKSQYVSHLGRHLQQVSHGAIPLSAMTEDDEDAEMSDDEEPQGHTKIATSAEPTQTQSFFVIPPRFRSNEICFGRRKEYDELDQGLFDKRRRYGTTSVLLHGPPGSGKSHLARQYFYTCRDRYSGGRFWIRANSKEEIHQSFWDIQRKCIAQGSPENLAHSVKSWFESRHQWLLIFDDIDSLQDCVIDELKKFVPDSEDSSIVYTSRDKSLSVKQGLLRPWPIEIEGLGTEAARDLLFQRLGIQEATEAEIEKAIEIVGAVDGMPLAINGMAQYLLNNEESLTKFDLASSFDLLFDSTYHELFYDLQCFQLSEAWNLIHILCWFGEEVPVGMLYLGLKDFRAVNVQASAHGTKPSLDATLSQLLRRGLIRRNEPSTRIPMSSHDSAELPNDSELVDTIIIHNFVRSYCCVSLKAKGRLPKWLNYAADLFHSSFHRADRKIKIRSEYGNGNIYDYRSYRAHGRRLFCHAALYDDGNRSLEDQRQNLRPVLSTIDESIQSMENGAENEREIADFQTSVFDWTGSDSEYASSEPDSEDDKSEPELKAQRQSSSSEFDFHDRLRQVGIVTFANEHIKLKEPPKSIVDQPREMFSEDPAPIREDASLLKGARRKVIPPGARWTKIDRKLVNPEALKAGSERYYEERLNYVIVLRILTKEDVEQYALKTYNIRGKRGERRDDEGSLRDS